MKKFLKMGLMGAMGSLLIAIFVFALPTNVDDLQLDGNDILDSGATTRITVGATNAVTGNLTVSGTLAPTGNTRISSTTVTGRILMGNVANDISTFTTTALALDAGLTVTVNGFISLRNDANPNTNVTPGAVGQIMFDSTTGDLCVSTVAAAGGWVLVSTPTTSCS